MGWQCSEYALGVSTCTTAGVGGKGLPLVHCGFAVQVSRALQFCNCNLPLWLLAVFSEQNCPNEFGTQTRNVLLWRLHVWRGKNIKDPVDLIGHCNIPCKADMLNTSVLEYA